MRISINNKFLTMTETYSPMAVANAFIRRAEQGRLQHLNPRKLQQLMFLLQAESLATLGAPIFDCFFIRSNHGPILPSLHHSFAAYDGGTIRGYCGHLIQETGGIAMKRPIIEPKDRDSWALIDALVARYSHVTNLDMADIVGHSFDQSDPRFDPDLPILHREMLDWRNNAPQATGA